MSMLKSSVAQAVAAVVAVTAGSTAFAAVGPNSGPSDLFIAVWNPSTSTSYVQDLGASFDFNDLTSSTGTFNTAGFTLNSAALDGGNLTTALGGAGTYNFALFAGNTTPAQNNGSNYLGNTAILSVTAGTALKGLTNAGAFTNTTSTFAYIDSNLPGSTTSFTATDNGQASSKYWASAANPTSPGNPGNDFQLPGWPGHAVGAGALSLEVFLSTATTDGGSDPTVASFVGSSNSNPGVFTLNDSTGVLSYSDTATTPLPAAAWLLVSGLLGLGAVGRRKAAASAA
jgi:hypothetical protein